MKPINFAPSIESNTQPAALTTVSPGPNINLFVPSVIPWKHRPMLASTARLTPFPAQAGYFYAVNQQDPQNPATPFPRYPVDLKLNATTPFSYDQPLSIQCLHPQTEGILVPVGAWMRESKLNFGRKSTLLRPAKAIVIDNQRYSPDFGNQFRCSNMWFHVPTAVPDGFGNMAFTSILTEVLDNATIDAIQPILDAHPGSLLTNAFLNGYSSAFTSHSGAFSSGRPFRIQPLTRGLVQTGNQGDVLPYNSADGVTSSDGTLVTAPTVDTTQFGSQCSILHITSLGWCGDTGSGENIAPPFVNETVTYTLTSLPYARPNVTLTETVASGFTNWTFAGWQDQRRPMLRHEVAQYGVMAGYMDYTLVVFVEKVPNWGSLPTLNPVFGPGRVAVNQALNTFINTELSGKKGIQVINDCDFTTVNQNTRDRVIKVISDWLDARR